MNVVTAVPSKQRTKVSAARRWAAASKSFTGISEQDPGVSLGNRQFRHLLHARGTQDTVGGGMEE